MAQEGQLKQGQWVRVGWVQARVVGCSQEESGLQYPSPGRHLVSPLPTTPVFTHLDSGNNMTAPQPAMPELSPAEEAGGPAGKVCNWGPGVCQPRGTGESQPQALACDLRHASVYPSV